VSARGQWRDWEPSRPLDVQGGIVARSRRGAIGEKWWSQRFIALLESFGAGSRLERGRHYARRGQVIELDVEPGIVLARVQGSRYTPYRVRLRTRLLSDAQWRRVEKALAARALPLAQLLAGEMPDDVEEVFAACGLTLFPSSAAELKPSCSCPDWEPVCKHVAAAYYLLAERFDEDPFAIFAWRGRERDELLEHLRQRRAKAAPGGLRRGPRAAGRTRADGAGSAGRARADGEGDTNRTVDRHVPSDGATVGVPPRAGEACEDVERFWGAGEGIAQLDISPLAGEAPDGLLRELGPLAFAGAEELAQLLAAAYGQLAQAAQDRALG
jgi:uncharacterized Zn finger protein